MPAEGVHMMLDPDKKGQITLASMTRLSALPRRVARRAMLPSGRRRSFVVLADHASSK
jgi:hypothetical protein